jgi:GDPmannose 4,6-dehydratase
MKILLTGITGQIGSYFAEHLLNLEHEVYGIIRRSSSFNTGRIDHIFDRINLHYGDVTDFASVSKIINEVRPDVLYNFAAMSHVKTSFDIPIYSTEVDYIGVLNILESIKMIDRNIKLYHASTSELFGDSPPPQNEKTLFSPRSPYAIAKLAAFHAVKNYREAYNLFACNGILFNTESERRGETFVTRKITKGLARILSGKQDSILLGNLDAKRDWNYISDSIDCIYKIMNYYKPTDFVIGSGESHSVREFIEESFKYVGITIRWEGHGINEKGFIYKNKKVIEISPNYFRPTEVEHLRADSSKAKTVLGWEPKINFKTIIKRMINSDLKKEGIVPIEII